MRRRPSHRGQYRGIDDRQQAYHRNKVFTALAAARRLRDDMRPAGVGLYRISPGVALRFATTLDDALPYLDDEEGMVRF